MESQYWILLLKTGESEEIKLLSEEKSAISFKNYTYESIGNVALCVDLVKLNWRLLIYVINYFWIHQ